MRTATTSVTGVGTSPPIPLDYSPNSAGEAGLFFTVPAGMTASLEVTPDSPYVAGATWFPLPAPFAGATADVIGRLPLPARAIRINQTIGVGTSILEVVSTGI